MKRILCLIMAVCVVGLTPIWAAEPEEKVLCSGVVAAEKLYSAPTTFAAEPTWDVEGFKEYLREELCKFSTEINLYSFNISASSENVDIISDILNYELIDCFHVSGAFRYSYYNGDRIMTLYVTYTMTPEEYAEKKAAWDKAVDEVIGDIRGNTSLTDEESALLIHDRLALRCEYDYENYLANTLPDISYTAYGCLVNGRSVCQGYAEAYQYLLEQVGIDSYLCASDALNHVWNIVEIDGDYYHVDVTWDDPVWDVPGYVRHTNFLCSSDVFLASHEAQDYDTSPNATKYDDYFWRNSRAAFLIFDGEIYYIDSKAGTLNTYDGTVLCSVSDKWMAGENSYWVGNFSCLATDGTDLYYSLSEEIYRYDISAGEGKKVYTWESAEEEFYSIYGFQYRDGVFEIVVNDTPSFDANTKRENTWVIHLFESYTVRGQITTPNPHDAFTVELLLNGSVMYSTVVSGTNGSKTIPFAISDVLAGVYDLRIAKEGGLEFIVYGIFVNQDIDLTTHVNETIANITPVTGDIDGDGYVDLKDVTLLTSSNTYSLPYDEAVNKSADLNGDGFFDLADLIILTSAENYGQTKTEVNY
ncbi:MAG: hypothetical protein IJ281_00840 [Clostridia bacterium]|nr:hypothetical protein [Clostridia bacterium]